MAVLGLLFGFYNIVLITIISSVVGAIALLIYNKVRKEGENKEYPFAVFIAPAAVIVMFVGRFIIDWYLSLFV